MGRTILLRTRRLPYAAERSDLGAGSVVKKLFEINPLIDRAQAARAYAADGRVQVRDVLTAETAGEIRRILLEEMRWGMAIGEGTNPPVSIRNTELATPAGVQRANQAAGCAQNASQRGDYGFRFAHYPIVDALNQGWEPGGVHELLLEHLNAPDFLQLARDVTGISALCRADAQATLFAANHYLGRHIDSHVAEGWRTAYVLNLAIDNWHPDWGGYLQFLDDDGDIVAGYRPRFNALNLFAVPQSHSVSYVAPFAPKGRLALTGWLSDR